MSKPIDINTINSTSLEEITPEKLIAIGVDFEPLREAIERLIDFKQGNHNFTAELYNLFAKADLLNTIKLRVGFPLEGLAFELWKQSKNERSFFKTWGIELPEHLDDQDLFT
jgi:hypothetical protein